MNRTPHKAAQWMAKTSMGILSLAGMFMAVSLGLPAFAQDAPQAHANASPLVTPTVPTDAKKASDPPAPATSAVVVADPRQAQIIADSQKLLKLSQELKAEVAKSNKDTLSIAVIKKADEVEKLAKTLKEEMNKAK
jgi:hypothetical protein